MSDLTKSNVCRDEEDEESTEDSEENETEDELDDEDVSSSEGDEEEAPAVKPYAALLQSLAVDSTPPAKRRKVDSSARQNGEQDEDEGEMLTAENGVDYVEEEEEGPETATEGILDDDDEVDITDPFEAHFADPDDNILGRRLKAIAKRSWSSQKLTLTGIGRAVVSIPEDGTTVASIPQAVSSPGLLKIKQKLRGAVERQRPSFGPLESTMAPVIFGYQDILYCERTHSNAEELRRLTCIHAINHVFKTRDRVIKNNARLAKEEGNDDIDLRDQGFTRPKVLMILPTRESCVRMVKMIVSLTEPEQQENRKRFDDSYVEKEEKFSDDKAEDFRELFSGNDDDMFRLGMKFTRKTVKYFSQFYNSDIIFASPLGLRMAIGTEESKKVDSDFLSSVEVVIVDQADALLLQNWEHVEFIFDHLNLQPKEAHNCDFSRVRSWYLDNNAKYFRQTIAVAAFNTPELNTLFFNQSQNWAGKVKINATYPGALQELGLKVKQTFSRLESPSFATDPDARFDYFKSAIVPSLTKHSKGNTGVLIFIPSYLDFVKVRNYFVADTSTSTVSFGSISEYTSVREVARARSHFYSGRHSVLLYTERAHHFRRYLLRGVKKVIMYSLPDNPIFYKEIVGGYLGRSMQEGLLEPAEGSARVVFSKWDILKLERVAGTERVGKMIREKGDTFDFL